MGKMSIIKKSIFVPQPALGEENFGTGVRNGAEHAGDLRAEFGGAVL